MLLGGAVGVRFGSVRESSKVGKSWDIRDPKAEEEMVVIRQQEVMRGLRRARSFNVELANT